MFILYLVLTGILQSKKLKNWKFISALRMVDFKKEMWFDHIVALLNHQKILRKGGGVKGKSYISWVVIKTLR